MRIYVSKGVLMKIDEYVEFLTRTCTYSIDEADTRRWEIEYQINYHCNPILMKPNTSGTMNFKSVLQRQEITRFLNNHSQLMRIINRRKGNKGNTQWKVDYIVSNNGDVFNTSIQCYNTFSENKENDRIMLDESRIRHIIRETLKRYLQL